MGRYGPGVAIRAAVILAASPCWTAFAGEEIHGAGATFPAPLYAAWSAEYRRSTGVRVTFDAVGSGEGIQRMRDRRIDFGASDAALTPQELTESGFLQFPVVIGGVVPVVNIRGIKPGQLKLSGALLADIYLGRIKKWNHVSISALNPTLALPNANITVVHRSDRSGSTLLWTDYLSRSSAVWRESGMGASLEPHWPTGIGGQGNEGVASYVQRTRFAIGYVEFIYARNHHLSDVALRNESGTFVRAGRDAFQAAAAEWSGPAPLQEQLATGLPGAASWPITGMSFIMIPQRSPNRDKTLAVLQFFNWALHEGEAMVNGLEYVPLPKPWVDQLPALWMTIRDSTGQRLWP